MKTRDYTIQSVRHALDILEQFRGNSSELCVMDLSRRLQLPKNKIYKLIATLEHHNYLEQNISTKNYRLGIKNMELGQVAMRRMRRLGDSRSVMEALVRECNETLCVSILKGSHAVNMDAVVGDNHLRAIPPIGISIPAHCTAAGKVLIAGLTEEQRLHYVSSCLFKRYTTATITNPKLFLRHLEEVDRQGYALELEEQEVGVKSVSAPIRDYTSRTIGAITVYGPSTRFPDDRMEKELIPLVLKGAMEISDMLGYRQSEF
ncbi:helix-turn-helix transcriptional regulator, IclR family [Geobacter metallireducens GS-15]|uniref:Helix-turn-helix transcriptional regulator, IclR family n=1 Tax=Geobacter metallireducens (strain ATCC 53774 / DSM 7210 / GS-15) TaxID=269799 RepID=Q39TD9_GEOMG|nr:IclR family transcriptional regulator [Geobacter metallireducens]ABB32485.1 helix-turn-helix transcriptional regulator, IclR family [Geobacter metallireducens GS-15]